MQLSSPTVEGAVRVPHAGLGHTMWLWRAGWPATPSVWRHAYRALLACHIHGNCKGKWCIPEVASTGLLMKRGPLPVCWGGDLLSLLPLRRVTYRAHAPPTRAEATPLPRLTFISCTSCMPDTGGAAGVGCLVRVLHGAVHGARLGRQQAAAVWAHRAAQRQRGIRRAGRGPVPGQRAAHRAQRR